MSNIVENLFPARPESCCMAAILRSYLKRSIAVCAGLVCVSTVNSYAAAKPAANSAKAAYARLPLSFEANEGQTDRQVKFLSRGDGYALFLTSKEAVIKLRTAKDDASAPSVVRMELLGASDDARITGAEPSQGTTNYLIGKDPAKWQTDVHTYGKVNYQAIYPGVDAVFYGSQRQLEYDFVVAAGADPGRIALGLTGVKPALDADGNVALKTAAGKLLLCKPVVYQGAGNGKKQIAAGYSIAGSTVRFQLGNYDHSQPLVIDPKFDYVTYLGGSSIDTVGTQALSYVEGSSLAANSLAIDASGNMYVTGQTYSQDFPTKNGYEDKWKGYNGRNQTAFVSKINATGTALVYSTYLGGSNTEGGVAIAVDSAGDVYVVGQTQSTDFPVTAGAFETIFPKTCCTTFVTKLNAAGNGLVYSTFLGGAGGGGSGTTTAYGVAVDAKDQAYVVGNTNCNCYPPSSGTPFPLTSNAFDKVQNNFAGSGYVTVFNAKGSELLYSSLIGDDQALQYSTAAQGVAVDASGNFYVTGITQSPNLSTTKGAFQEKANLEPGVANPVNAFAAKFAPVTGSGNLLTYLTYLHATGVDYQDFGSAIVADSEGNAYVGGNTYSPTYPGTKGAYQTTCPGYDVYCAFLTKLNPTGTALVWSTLLGNSGNGNTGFGAVYSVSSVALDALGNVYLAGQAGEGFPAVDPVEPVDTSTGGFISKFNPSGSALLFSSLIGDTGTSTWIEGAAVDPLGNIYVAGAVGHANGIPITPGAFQKEYGGGQYDGWAAKIHIEAPDLTIAKTHTGSFKQGETAAEYTITVSNAGDRATSGTVTVTEDVPAGLTLESMEGAGWTCKIPSCTTTAVLAVGKSYPAITVGVDVAENAPATVTNIAKVSGGGEYNVANDSASDATTIVAVLTTPTVKVTPSATSITTLEALTVTIAVEGVSGKPTPTGTVKLTSGKYASAVETLSGGSAKVVIPAGALAVGSDTLAVAYTPDAAGAHSYTKASGAAKVTVTETAAATPTFSPGGGSYTAKQTVTISDKTKSAVIYYTTNGSTPTTASTKYTGAISIAKTETLKAIATAPGYAASAVASATYTIK